MAIFVPINNLLSCKFMTVDWMSKPIFMVSQIKINIIFFLFGGGCLVVISLIGIKVSSLFFSVLAKKAFLIVSFCNQKLSTLLA